MNTYERRRVALAVIVTAIALPTLWWAKRDNPISSPSVAAIDGGQSVDKAAAANIASEDDPPGYLSGPSVEIPPLVAEPTGPPLEESFTRAGRATYRNFTTDPDRLCEVAFLPAGTRVTVENTDNGKKHRLHGRSQPPRAGHHDRDRRHAVRAAGGHGGRADPRTHPLVRRG